MDGVQGLRAWRWLLVIEGLPSVCLGVFGWFFLADSPETAWYLSPEQRKILILRGTRNQREAFTVSAGTLHRADIIAAVKDWKIWAFSLFNFGGDIQLFSYSIFLPTIIQAINPAWSVIYVQALTVPCYVLSAIMYFVSAYASDKLQHRALFGILGSLVSIVGHIMLMAGRDVAVPYVGCFLIASGLFTVAGIALAWLPTNLPRYGKRSTAVGMQLMIGNSAGIAAPAVVSGVLWWAMANINKRRAAGEEDWKMSGLTEEQIDELGDESPKFVYTT
ncbi:MAG: hypothetical protein Q9224_004222 [Gallowayella concinna]